MANKPLREHARWLGEKRSFDCDPRSAVVGLKALKPNQMIREQRLHIRAVQLRWVRVVVYQHQRGKLMMTSEQSSPKL